MKKFVPLQSATVDAEKLSGSLFKYNLTQASSSVKDFVKTREEKMDR